MRDKRVGAWPQGVESATKVEVKAADGKRASCLEKAGKGGWTRGGVREGAEIGVCDRSLQMSDIIRTSRPIP